MPPYFYKYGEKGSGFRAPTADAVQDYDAIKDKCLRDGQLFEDPVFPANQSSIFYSKRGTEFKWLRPSELIENPMFISDGASRFDVMQGELGDCWLLAAVANLTMNQKLFQRVVPPDQFLSGPEYTGVFHFRFWRYGKWIDVVIDDRLPTFNGRLVFMHSKDKKEFWSALLEKAYAKLHGSYEALKGGSTCEALEDFTGGVTEYYELNSNECPPNLFQIMQKASERSSFMGCSIDALSSSQQEAELENGLIKGHAYSITAVRTVELRTARVQGKCKIPLLRIRNPWGNEAEWKGAWSDKSREWSVISEDEKRELQLTFEADGEFWMSFQDFKNNYTRLEICNLTPEPLEDGADACKQWEAVMFDGAWISGVSAGGCRNHLETFALNPQYLVKLTDYDEEDDDNLCTLIIALMQKNRRAKRRMGADALTIGFAVYALKDGHFQTTDEPVYATTFKKQLLTTEYFKYNASVARSPNFINLREVCARFKLPPGNYCIIPSTFDPNEEGEFLLRIFMEKPPGMAEENDDEVGIIEKPTQANGVVDNVATDKDKTAPEPKDSETQEGNTQINGQQQRNETPADNANKCSDILKMIAACWTLFHPSQAQEAEKIQRAKQENGLNELFAKIAGEDMEVDPVELQQILNHALKKEYKFDGFSLDSCRSMVALMDDDKSGMLGIDEFILLWKSIRHWCAVFKKFDTDNSNTINASELRSALQEAGLSVNRNILKQIIQRYGTITSGKKGEIKVERSMSFDAFICSCIKLKHSIDVWNERAAKKRDIGSRYSSAIAIQKRSSDNLPSFTLDEWVENVMYC
ncbi:calpain-B-like isoform X4 [Dinothrombium tinctorium]|uniref:Calpain-B-like isoform X4 n=1 Tax=Dinothrombium tinctorium TaxID=1965070 RepID=A0A443R854_9ACAR|nr:calpain-B-like isoform X4 [Dinothrombium tinctorium]